MPTARRPRVAGARRAGAGRPVDPVSVDPVPVDPVPAGLVLSGAGPVDPGSVGAGPVDPVPVAPDRAVAPDEPQLLVVGRIGKPQGIRGEVTVQVRTDDPDARFADGARLLTDPPGRGPLTVASSRDQNGRLMVAFEGVVDRNGAEELRGTLVLVDAAQLPAPDDPDVFHDFQLVGLRAELPDGAPLGAVVEVLHLPHGDVLAVRRTGAGAAAAEVLVPFVAAMVPVVDVAGGRVVVDPPAGLLDLSEPASTDDDDDDNDADTDADNDAERDANNDAEPDADLRPGSGTG